MSYRLDNLRKKKNIKVALSLLIVSVVFYFFYQSISRFGYTALSYLAVPLWRAENNIANSVSSASNLFRSMESLTKENEVLRQTIRGQAIRLQSLQILERENQDLMIAMGNIGKNNKKAILVSVLTGPNVPPYDSLVIDAGSDSGIFSGDKVFYGDNVLIGEISELHGRSSKVRLYSSYGLITDVIIKGLKDQHVAVRGYGSGNYYFELPGSVSIVRGTILTIPGSNNYILGVVDDIEFDSATASQKILARSPFNIRLVRFVRVIKDSNNGPLE